MILSKCKKIGKISFASIFVLVVGGANMAFSDAPPPEKFEERIPIKKEERIQKTQFLAEEGPEYKFRLSPGLTVWTFDEEDTTAGPALFFDVWRTDVPVNFRVGIEGRHLNLEQAAAAPIAEFPGKESELTFIRIPFAVEYFHDIAENTRLYVGGGPDIIRTANDLSDTAVGLHLGTRLHYAFNQNWGVALEGGYLWAEVDGKGTEIDLDTAYITPQLAYTF